jgi:hypothetical protein
MVEGIPYIIAQITSVDFQVSHCDSNTLPYGNTLGKDGACFTQRIIRIPEEVDATPTGIPVQSVAGLSITYHRYPPAYDEFVTTKFWFLPGASINDSVNSFPVPGEDDFGCSFLIGEMIHRVRFSATTGRCGVFLIDHSTEMDDETPFMSLHLVRLKSNPTAIHIRHLEVPYFVDLKEVTSLEIDEHRGVVFLIVSEVFLFALPYA